MPQPTAPPRAPKRKSKEPINLHQGKCVLGKNKRVIYCGFSLSHHLSVQDCGRRYNEKQWKSYYSRFRSQNSHFFFRGLSAPKWPGSPHYWEFTIKFRHTTLDRTPLDEWSARHRDMYLTTNNSHKRETSIRNHNPSKLAAASPRLRLLGHRHRHFQAYYS